ncbi:hypothetical protein MAC_07328 [Metarhizium acridum CQMa 102]|uniref:Uncharacterized protein n=1 Tax=Metarhizium acridum (strain CQMa 102) TaxID=655827 RepID=E9EBT0_METAQ|nr:uncharacterized protein MAC_07328 [Metarhizium acridum CQMa 102]EFY86639.1 hypothetical protein MAC_07328 [Metarhizium acridum CQMa 102]
MGSADLAPPFPDDVPTAPLLRRAAQPAGRAADSRPGPARPGATSGRSRATPSSTSAAPSRFATFTLRDERVKYLLSRGKIRRPTD